MSGIYGFAVRNSVPNPAVMLNRMREAIQPPWPMVEHQWTAQAGRAGLGVLHPARIGEPGHFAGDSLARVFCVFDGVIYRDAGAHGGNLVEPDGAALLLDRYLKSGTECLSGINGSFNVAWWDEKTGRLVLANDKLGQRPLFFALRNGVLAFASIMARVVAAGILTPEIDVEGLADLLSYTYTLGERTLLEGIRVLPPATVLTYEKGRIHSQQYWHLGQVEPHGRYDERRLDELEDLFKTVVRRSFRPDLTCSISLTGGLDSRCILAAAANQRLSFITHTGGQPDSTDVTLAKEAATQVGVQHFFELIDPQGLGVWLTPMVLYQGGIVATLHSHPCQTLYSPYPFDLEVTGVRGEFIRGRSDYPRHFDLSDIAALREPQRRWMSTRATLYLERLWRPQFRLLGIRAPQEHLDAILSTYRTQDSPVAVLEYFHIYERFRKYLNKAHLITRASREVYFPYLDHQWVEAIAAIPISERVANRIQVDLIRRLCPALLRIPYAKNLIPLSVPLWRTRAIERYRGIKRSIRRKIGRRLGFAVPNHKPNLYSRWSRHEMRPALVELLYNPNAAFRAYLRWETVETLLNQHFSGKEDWQDLVAALAVFEIAHRLWVAQCDQFLS